LLRTSRCTAGQPINRCLTLIVQESADQLRDKLAWIFGDHVRREAHSSEYELKGIPILGRPLGAQIIELQVVQKDAPFGLMTLRQRESNELLRGFHCLAFIHSPDTLLMRAPQDP